MRRLLASYVGMAAADLKFNYGPRGKPELDATSQDPAIQFNVSHRGALALYAFVLDRAVGIDIEYLREVPEALAIARNHFTATETRLLERAAMIGEFVSDERPGERAAIERRGRECFFRLWTRKEAVIKAVGTGLSMPLDEFDVSSEAVDEGPWRHDPCSRAPTPYGLSAICRLPRIIAPRFASPAARPRFNIGAPLRSWRQAPLLHQPAAPVRVC